MKKVLKKEVVIAFIIGILLATGIMVYADNYLATQINYTRNNNTITVSSALDELYTKTKYNHGTGQVKQNGTIEINLGFEEPTEIWIHLDRGTEMWSVRYYLTSGGEYRQDYCSSSGENAKNQSATCTINGTIFSEPTWVGYENSNFNWAAVK